MALKIIKFPSLEFPVFKPTDEKKTPLLARVVLRSVNSERTPAEISSHLAGNTTIIYRGLCLQLQESLFWYLSGWVYGLMMNFENFGRYPFIHSSIGLRAVMGIEKT